MYLKTYNLYITEIEKKNNITLIEKIYSKKKKLFQHQNN